MPVSGVLPVIPTPFRGGTFDRDSFARLLDHFLADADGYTLSGSTGEAPSLTDEQRRTVVEEAMAMTPADATVVVGVSHTSAAVSAELARHAEAHGAHGVLCCAPFYFNNDPRGIEAHLAAIDAAISIDLVFYDNPVTTKTKIQAAWVTDWATRLERLTAVKLTDHDLPKIPVWREAGLNVFAGDDAILSQFLAADIDGCMVIAPAVLPGSFARAWELRRQGDVPGALEVLSREVVPFLHAFGIGDEIATTKALLADLGIFATDELHSPLQPVDSARRAQLRQAFDLCRSAAAARTSAEAVA